MFHCEPSSDRTKPSVCSMSSTQTVFVFCQKGGIFMSSDTPTINMAATGANIKALIKTKGLKVADVQIGILCIIHFGLNN